MDEYKKLCEELEKTYMTYALTGNKDSHIAKILLESAAAINALSTENARLTKQLDIAEHEIMRREEEMKSVMKAEQKRVEDFLNKTAWDECISSKKHWVIDNTWMDKT